MSKKVVYYTDKPNKEFSFGQEIMPAIHKFLDVQEFVSINAKSIVGFQSGVNWEDLQKQGFVAVVLYDVNDACAFGISIEAGDAGLKVYEIFLDGLLLELSHLRIGGKKGVLGLSPEQIAVTTINPSH